MQARMQDISTPICILAGGASRRFGSPKGLALLNGETLLDKVSRAVSAQTQGPVALNTAPDGPYAGTSLPIVPDLAEGQVGALIGLHAAMNWAANIGSSYVVTCPIDTPFLPQDLVLRLHDSGAPAICASNGRWHPIIGLWPTALAAELEEFLKKEARSVHAWAQRCGSAVIDFSVDEAGRDPFFNINSQSDLDAAKAAK